jgi:amino acid transporter/mannitol/fructose-specific phosphotransferase system IIA component (Ntr-type)
MKKNLGFFSIFCISAGAMISSGLFVLPGLAFARAGPAVFISYFLAGCVAITTVFSLSELVTAMPKAGGDYFYVSRSFGQLFGTVSGILSWLALSLKSAFAIIGLAEIIYLAFGYPLVVSALVLTLFFAGLNLAGVQEAARFQIGLVIALFAILVLFSFTGLQRIQLSRYEPFLSHGFNAVISTAGFVFVSYGGVLTTASIAGEIKNPTRNIPLGLISSTIAVTLAYLAVTFVIVGVVPGRELVSNLAPVATAGKAIGGQGMYLAILAASLMAFVTTANGGILTASRYPIALARDGMFPRAISAVTRKKETPYVAIMATAVLIGLSVTLNLDLLIKAASTVILLSNIFAHLSVIVMRESKISTYLPTFRAPFYPWLQIVSIIIFLLLIIDMGITPMLLSLLFVVAGVIIYFIRRSGNQIVSPAVLHLVERITNRKLGTRHLSDELRTIISARDNIVKDEFDRAIEASTFLDIEDKIDFKELAERLAATLHRELDELEEEEIRELFIEREEDSSTAISDFVAIPHIIIEGERHFSIVLVRARDGIRFSGKHPAVKAVFVLIGSKDLRNLHLRALTAIAQIVHHPKFEQRWLEAKGHMDLQDLFLLGARRRAPERDRPGD